MNPRWHSKIDRLSGRLSFLNQCKDTFQLHKEDFMEMVVIIMFNMGNNKYDVEPFNNRLGLAIEFC